MLNAHHPELGSRSGDWSLENEPVHFLQHTRCGYDPVLTAPKLSAGGSAYTGTEE